MSIADKIIRQIVEAAHPLAYPDAPQGGTVAANAQTILPEHGYYVGGTSAELVIESLDTLDRGDVEAFVAGNLSDFVGWWADSQTGRIHIDDVEWVAALPLAERVGRARGEIALWDIAEGREIRL